MTSLYFIRFIKTLMVTTPFLAMIIMVLALWGVGGKATYSDQNAAKLQIELGAGEAKNYLVKELKNNKPSSTESELESPDISLEVEKNAETKKEPTPEKVVWGLEA